MINKAKRRVLLIRVPQCERSIGQEEKDLSVVRNFQPYLPLSLAYLGAFLNEYASEDYLVTIEDINTKYVVESEGYVDCNVMDRMMESVISDTEYDIIGISSAFVNNLDWVQRAVQLANEYHPGKPVILGGGYPTVYPEKSLEQTGADYAIIGEGEDTLLSLLNRISGVKNSRFEKLFSQISGYVYRENGEIHTIPKTTVIDDLDLIPFPAWDILDVEEYLGKQDERMLLGYTSRGCPFRCTYCGTHLAWGSGIRFRSAENVLMEIDFMYREYGIKNIHFVDDNMTANKKRMNTILNGLIERDYDLTWQASNFAVNSLDKETIALMIPSKMAKVTLAIESGSQSTQKQINKNLDLKKAEEVFRMFEQYDIPIHLNFMIGFPMETVDEIQATIDLANRLGAHETQVNIVTPWPGTELYEYVLKHKNLNREIAMEDMDHRKPVGFVNVPWNYVELNHLSYDTNISLNFVNNRDLNDPKSYPRLMQRWKGLEASLPQHAILFVCIGYLHKQMGNLIECNNYYDKAAHLFKKKDVDRAYGKYLNWDNNLIIKDFKDHV
jgi:magnesium-protoporphyrin IX monomethyl ester (oxidative) cyclase|tara:strand:+ start:6067 stop:7728 length:1662 start_codon:yes stop_codon:yes gene_type:complete